MRLLRSMGGALLLALLVLALDMVWLGVVMRDFYAAELGSVLRREGESLSPRWGPAAVVYLLIAGGLLLFVQPKLARPMPLWRAIGHGAAFGCVLYGVYDFTNLAILNDWTWRIAAADVVWGAVLCGLCTIPLWLWTR